MKHLLQLLLQLSLSQQGIVPIQKRDKMSDLKRKKGKSLKAIFFFLFQNQSKFLI